MSRVILAKLRADMSNVVNLDLDTLYRRVNYADTLIDLAKKLGDTSVLDQFELQRRVLVNEIQSRKPPPVVVSLDTLDLRAQLLEIGE